MTSFLYFILGSLLTFILSPYCKELIERWRLRPSWNTFFKCLTDKKITDPLLENTPDVLIGVNNGIVPASILATNLGIEELYYFHTFPKADKDGCREVPSFHEIKNDLSGKKILIVDDQLHSGTTMDNIYRFILKQPGVKKELVSRLAIFRRTNTSIQNIEFPSPGKLRDAIRKVPWSFTKEHKLNTQHQQQKNNNCHDRIEDGT